MKRVFSAVVLLVACHGKTSDPGTSAPSVKTVTAVTASGTSAATPVEAGVDDGAAPSASATVAPAPSACSGAALTQRALVACPGRGMRPTDPSKLSFTASAQRVSVKSGESVELTFVLKNDDTVARTIDLEVPADAGLPTYVHAVAPLDIELVPPRLDLECISGSGPVKTAAPPVRTNPIEVELSPGGTLTWSRKVDAMGHGWVIDRAKLVGFTGSGTPCMESSTPVPKGVHHVSASSFVRSIPPITIEVTVL